MRGFLWCMLIVVMNDVTTIIITNLYWTVQPILHELKNNFQGRTNFELLGMLKNFVGHAEVSHSFKS